MSTMTHTAGELCTELRRMGRARYEDISIITQLWGMNPKDMVPLLKCLKSCGIVEGALFRRDVWCRTRGLPNVSVTYELLSPNQFIHDEYTTRYEKEKERCQKAKEAREHDIYFMAGI